MFVPLVGNYVMLRGIQYRQLIRLGFTFKHYTFINSMKGLCSLSAFLTVL
jgi:hypothetical protein